MICSTFQRRSKKGPGTEAIVSGTEAFIFATVGVGTTSGFDYQNAINDDGSMTWTGVDTSHTGQPQVARIAIRAIPTHVLVRHDPRSAFVYLGVPQVVEVQSERPVRMRFRFETHAGGQRVGAATSFSEGAAREVSQTVRERDASARALCLKYWGSRCVVCGIDAPWNHVHHLYPLAEGEREVNPVTDLRPVCPSCHAMIHWFTPLLSIDEARVLLIEHIRPVVGAGA
jgi:5-methylcytosine-specific restriction protein A